MKVVCALLVLLFSSIHSFVPPTKSNGDVNSSLEGHVLQLEQTLMDVQAKAQVQEQKYAAVLSSVLSKLTSTTDELIDVRKEMDTLKNDHQSLQKKFYELEHKQTTQENETSCLRIDLISSEINLRSVTDGLTQALKQHVGFLNANISNIKDDIENLEQNLTREILNSGDLKSTVNALTPRFRLLEDEVINLYSNVSATSVEVKNMESSLDQRKSVDARDNTTLSDKLRETHRLSSSGKVWKDRSFQTYPAGKAGKNDLSKSFQNWKFGVFLLCSHVYKVVSLKPSGNGEESFLVRLSSDIHPPKNSVITFQEVIQNLGNSYNRTTGKFTASVSGIYLFHVSATGNIRVQVDIVMDGDLLATAWGRSGDRDNNAQGSNMAVVHMRQGQRVWARFMLSGKYLLSGGHTQFTGALLRTD